MRKIYLKHFWQKLAMVYLFASLLLVQSFALAHAAVHFLHAPNSERVALSASPAKVFHVKHFANLVDESSCDIWELVSAKSFTPAEDFLVSTAKFAQPDLVVAQFAAVLIQTFPFFYSQAPPKIS